MKRRHRNANEGDITTQLGPLVDDDAFLTELSQGNDPSDGADELAALFLELRDDVEKQMPPAPLIEGADEEPVVISLASRRRARAGRPFVSGLLGAAAATLVIAGSGSLLYNATPESPLWGVSSALFSDRAAVVELAGTLEEIDSRAAEGDMDGTRALLEEARRMVSNVRDEQATTTTQRVPREQATVTTTVTTPATGQAEPATETVTETAHHTETATVTVTEGPAPVRPNPLPVPTEPSPLPDPLLPGNPGGGEELPTLQPPQIQE
ncbi:MAG: hypothetical protein Q4G50_11985 [Corynebacterium sp.]|uniref:hypothetical protein n=1 Tax=Corynebacterium sp. TaxID=1720 RepID=UPI0026E0E5C1|nr:hypothetical protein [Corynebacterium sp.]MDO5670703.1 hypothetical protein [Corynebacterium sp.]